MHYAAARKTIFYKFIWYPWRRNKTRKKCIVCKVITLSTSRHFECIEIAWLRFSSSQKFFFFAFVVAKTRCQPVFVCLCLPFVGSIAMPRQHRICNSILCSSSRSGRWSPVESTRKKKPSIKFRPTQYDDVYHFRSFVSSFCLIFAVCHTTIQFHFRAKH